MNLIIGIITVVACTMGGYMLEGGHLEVLAKAAPLEIVIMGGTAAGGFGPGIFTNAGKDVGHCAAVCCSAFSLARAAPFARAIRASAAPYSASAITTFPATA